ncbi:MAG: c-type cytochrome, partial [Verrucomicrobiota bacterium]
FIAEATGQRGQWGLTQDNFGRIYFNSNSDFLRTNPLPESLASRNPNFPSTAGLGFQVLKDQTTWPGHPTPGVNRGYDLKTLREDGSLAASTATCGPAIYRGSLFPREYRGNAFIPEPAGNLVKRVLLSEKDGVVTGDNASTTTEFWTSTDERFRPVNAFSGPDGALYVVDQYRGVIQHKHFLTHYLVANIKERNLETPFDMGRIWRIVPDKAKAASTKIPSESSLLVKLLGNENGWVRDTAQRLLVERKDASVTPQLQSMATKAKNPLAKIHALWTLEGTASVTPEVISACLKDKDPKVRATSIYLTSRAQLSELATLVEDPSVDVQIALAFQLSAFPETQKAALELAVKAGTHPLVRDAFLSGLRGRELETLQALIESRGASSPPAVVEALAQAVMAERRKERVAALISLLGRQPAKSPLQKAILSGAAGKAVATKNSSAVKLLYLESAPPELEQLALSLDAGSQPLLKALDSRLAWPNKPGVPPPPVVKPLTQGELALFETGKGVYASLCAGCHQPNGTGMQGLAPALMDSEWVLAAPEIAARILLHGLAGPIKVGSVSWNLEMPPLGAALTDEQI